MFKNRQSHKKTRPYRVKKTGIKDENIDRQILAIHRAMALKLIADHKAQGSLVEQVQQNLDERRDEGRMGYGEYLTWSSALAIIEDEKSFIEAVCEDSQRMRKFRRRTPFVGVLTEQERQAALEADSLGTLSDLSTLF
jgi:hypothetical protein